MNKVKFGLSQLHIAPVKGDEYEKPVEVPGIVNIELDASGNSSNFFAQNIPYYTQFKNNGYTGTMEIALFPDDLKAKLLGWYQDENGKYVEDADGTSVKFAMLYQVEGDEKASRNVLYDCEISRPSKSAQTTEEEISPDTDTVNLTVVPKYFSELDKNIVGSWCYQGDTDYSTFFESVPKPGQPKVD